jgi:hypothetical protein
MDRSKSQIAKDRASNEVVFRTRNERVQENIQEFNKTAAELGEVLVDTKGKEYLFFLCECSDEKCTERIKISFANYKRIHEERDAFIVRPHHNVQNIEETTDKTKAYWVVKKGVLVPQKATELKPSGLDNA